MTMNLSSKPLSNNSGAMRSRKFRERERLRKAEVANSNAQHVQAPPIAAAPPPPPRPEPAPFTLHETTRVELHEEKPFSAPALVLLDGSGTAEQATKEAPAEPVVPPAPEPPPPPPPQTSAAEAAGIAKLVRMYVEFGIGMIFAKRQEHVAAMAPPGSPIHEVLKHADKVFGFVEQSAYNVCLKYNLRVPYQDEIVVAAAFGLASWGIAMKPGDATRAKEAKNANVPNPSGETKLDDAPPTGGTTSV